MHPLNDYTPSSILSAENDICYPNSNNNNYATPFPDDYYNLNYSLFLPDSLQVQQINNMYLQEFEGLYLQFLDLFYHHHQHNGLPLNPSQLIHGGGGADFAADPLPNVVLDEVQDINGGKRDRLGKKKKKKKVVRSSKKDRHSKINTANGPRDRRMRLSLDVARKFFHLQDLLGYDKASRTVDWLLKNSGAAIRDLTRNRCRDTTEEDAEVAAADRSELPSCNKTKPQRNGAAGSRVTRTVGRESRRKARERARERVSQKRRLGRESNCTSDHAAAA